MLFSAAAASLALSLFSATVSADVSNFTSTDCVSPSGFNSCFNTASDKADACVSGAGGNLPLTLACGCQLYLDEINCALESCWNEVYSCQYQEAVIRYLTYCPSTSPSQFPFYPPPDNAPGGCSCNLGYVYDNVTNAIGASGTCGGNNFQSVDGSLGCVCCEQAGVYTSLYKICPDVNPKYLGLDVVNSLLGIYDQPFDQCGTYLNEFDCVKDLGFTAIGSMSTYIQASATSSSGSLSYSDVGGAITSPLSGDTFVWTAPASNTYTIIAAAATNAAATGSSGATGGGSGATPVGSGQSPSSTHSAATTAAYPRSVVALGAIITFLAAAL